MTVTTGLCGIADGPLLHTLQPGIRCLQGQLHAKILTNHQHRQNSESLPNRYFLTSEAEEFAGR